MAVSMLIGGGRRSQAGPRAPERGAGRFVTARRSPRGAGTPRALRGAGNGRGGVAP